MNGPHVDPTGLDATGPEREQAVAHVQDCAICRDRVAAEDPTRLLALLALRPVPQEVLEAVSSGVTRRMTAARPSLVDGLREGFLSRAAAAAAVVALAVGAGALVFGPSRPSVPPVPLEATTQRAGVAVTATPGAARIVDLSVGDVQVVMIFDPEIKL